MPQKVRQLIAALKSVGFTELKKGGKGSPRKFLHRNFSGAATVSGKLGDGAKPYQERRV